MVDTDPEDLGIQLAEKTDERALREEAKNDSKEGLLNEALTTFHVKFSENHEYIQHDLIEIAFKDQLRSYHTDPENITKKQVTQLARDFARDALYEYLNFILEEHNISYSDIPNAENEIFDLKTVIVDGYWNDTAQVLIEQAKE